MLGVMGCQYFDTFLEILRYYSLDTVRDPQFKYVIFLQELGNLVENVEKSLRWRVFWIPELIMLLVTVFQSETLVIVPFRLYSISDATTFINRKNLEKDVYVNF